MFEFNNRLEQEKRLLGFGVEKKKTQRSPEEEDDKERATEGKDDAEGDDMENPTGVVDREVVEADENIGDAREGVRKGAEKSAAAVRESAKQASSAEARERLLALATMIEAAMPSDEEGGQTSAEEREAAPEEDYAAGLKRAITAFCREQRIDAKHVDRVVAIVQNQESLQFLVALVEGGSSESSASLEDRFSAQLEDAPDGVKKDMAELQEIMKSGKGKEQSLGELLQSFLKHFKEFMQQHAPWLQNVANTLTVNPDRADAAVTDYDEYREEADDMPVSERRRALERHGKAIDLQMKGAKDRVRASEKNVASIDEQLQRIEDAKNESPKGETDEAKAKRLEELESTRQGLVQQRKSQLEAGTRAKAQLETLKDRKGRIDAELKMLPNADADTQDRVVQNNADVDTETEQSETNENADLQESHPTDEQERLGRFNALGGDVQFEQQENGRILIIDADGQNAINHINLHPEIGMQDLQVENGGVSFVPTERFWSYLERQCIEQEGGNQGGDAPIKPPEGGPKAAEGEKELNPAQQRAAVRDAQRTINTQKGRIARLTVRQNEARRVRNGSTAGSRRRQDAATEFADLQRQINEAKKRITDARAVLRKYPDAERDEVPIATPVAPAKPKDAAPATAQPIISPEGPQEHGFDDLPSEATLQRMEEEAAQKDATAADSNTPQDVAAGLRRDARDLRGTVARYREKIRIREASPEENMQVNAQRWLEGAGPRDLPLSDIIDWVLHEGGKKDPEAYGLHNLRTLDAESAKEINVSKIDLSGLTSVDPAALAALSPFGQRFSINLDGLPSVTPAHIEAISLFHSCSLNGITQLSPELVEAMQEHIPGDIEFAGVTQIDEATARALAKADLQTYVALRNLQVDDTIGPILAPQGHVWNNAVNEYRDAAEEQDVLATIRELESIDIDAPTGEEDTFVLRDHLYEMWNRIDNPEHEDWAYKNWSQERKDEMFPKIAKFHDSIAKKVHDIEIRLFGKSGIRLDQNNSSEPDLADNDKEQEAGPAISSEVQEQVDQMLVLVTEANETDVRSPDVKDLGAIRQRLQGLYNTFVTFSYSSKEGWPPQTVIDTVTAVSDARQGLDKKIAFVEKRMGLRQKVITEGRELVGKSKTENYSGIPVTEGGPTVGFSFEDSLWKWYYTDQPGKNYSPRFIPDPNAQEGRPDPVELANLPLLPSTNEAFMELRPVMQELSAINEGKYDVAAIMAHNDGDALTLEALVANAENDDPLYA